MTLKFWIWQIWFEITAELKPDKVRQKYIVQFIIRKFQGIENNAVYYLETCKYKQKFTCLECE